MPAHTAFSARSTLPGPGPLGGPHGGPGEWLDLIHATNELDPTAFGSPTATYTDADRQYEVYARFTVEHEGDGISGRTFVVAHTDTDGMLLARAAGNVPNLTLIP